MRTMLGPTMLGVTLLLSASGALAQARPYPECAAQPTEGNVAAAKGAFQAGQASFNEADYTRAITYWEDAYRRDCTAHALLLNLARAYELSGDKPQAVEALQTYLVRKPESPQKDQINRRIEVLKQQIAKETPAAPPPPAPAAATASAAKPPPPAAPKAPAEAAPPAAKQETSNGYWVGPLIVGGVGVVTATTGFFVLNSGRSDEEEAAALCPTRSCPDPAVIQLGNDGIAKQKLGVGLIVGGAAAVGGALVWYLLARPEPKTSPAPSAPVPAKQGVWVLPEFDRRFAGMTLVGNF